jgi:serine/threonine protein phosphatase PrpC
MTPERDPVARVSAASAQGERSHQEDRFVHQWIDLPSIPKGIGWLLGVFDGHRGGRTADKASHEFIPLFSSMLDAHGGNVPAALRDTFASLNKMTRVHICGSTASVVFVPQDAESVYMAVLGDSPVAVLSSDGKVHVGPDHNVRTNSRERSAALARGGVFYEGYLEDSQLPGVGLQMARALGDADLDRVLSREPEIETFPLGGKGIVLVGSDGLLLPGAGSNQDQLARLLSMIHQGADAEVLIQDALRRQTGDNVTAIVWRKD